MKLEIKRGLGTKHILVITTDEAHRLQHLINNAMLEKDYKPEILLEDGARMVIDIGEHHV